ncbi:MAG: N-6 DNA methylase [Bacteroidetes bacterium]|nr:N-6 DNA methylase [Bacteroidota bacterium]
MKANITELEPLEKENPVQYADRLGLIYSSNVIQKHKKENGQYFTSVEIARFLASLSHKFEKTVKILDPGCGAGILTCALVEHLVSNSNKLKEIDITSYEIDTNLISYTTRAFSYLKEWCISKQIDLIFEIIHGDFILNNKFVFGFDRKQKETNSDFDIVISNPPYFKLSKEDKRAIIAQSVTNGHPNIYSIFMAASLKLLKEGGEFIFITPRSFSSGNYFKTFRNFFFFSVRLDYIHLFVSRKETFERDNVLQETIIMKGQKNFDAEKNNVVTITSSKSADDLEKCKIKAYNYKELIDLSSKEKILHTPISDFEEKIFKLFKNWNSRLQDYDLQISTGPVVAHRAVNFIRDTEEPGSVPLFWLHNVNKMEVNPLNQKPNKGQYIQLVQKSLSILVKNRDYIFLRRFSSKDDKSRLIASPYFKDSIDAKLIGIENKLNYIYKKNGEFQKNELIGLAALLNSDLFDSYFRTFNGNINVSATELREMPFPTEEEIKKIGDNLLELNNFTSEAINDEVNNFFGIKHFFVNEEN